MSVGRPRWAWRSTCSTACWTWDARSTSASPDPDGVGGSAPAPMIHAPRCGDAEPITWAASTALEGRRSVQLLPCDIHGQTVRAIALRHLHRRKRHGDVLLTDP